MLAENATAAEDRLQLSHAANCNVRSDKAIIKKPKRKEELIVIASQRPQQAFVDELQHYGSRYYVHERSKFTTNNDAPTATIQTST